MAAKGGICKSGGFLKRRGISGLYSNTPVFPNNPPVSRANTPTLHNHAAALCRCNAPIRQGNCAARSPATTQRKVRDGRFNGYTARPLQVRSFVHTTQHQTCAASPSDALDGPNAAPRYGREIVGSICALFRFLVWAISTLATSVATTTVPICRILRYFGGTSDDHCPPCGCG